MRPRRPASGDVAVAEAVAALQSEFRYPDLFGGAAFAGAQERGGAPGMAHYLIVSEAEPAEVQLKADYVVPDSNSSARLQAAFTEIGTRASNPTIWMAGVFNLDTDVSAPAGAWIRGLGYNQLLISGGSE